MNILITGSNGYLANYLIEKFYNLNVFKLNRKNNTKNFILNANPDIIIHTISSYGRNNESPSHIYNSNLITGIKLLEICNKINKPITFINCGTSLKKETNLYSLSKGQMVEFGKFFSNEKLQFINMNLEHFYGPNAPKNFLSFVVNECKANRDLALTKGTQKRDFLYIEDACDAFENVIKFRHKLERFETLDVGTGISNSVRSVVEKIKILTRSKSNLNFGIVPLRETDLVEMKADIRKLNSIGWYPKHSLEKGLSKII